METLPLSVGEILHYEATSMTRENVPASTGLKAGQLVDFALRGAKVVALTDEHEGKVQVQPHNCVIDLRHTPAAEIEDLDAFKKAGDTHGIVYRGTLKTA